MEYQYCTVEGLGLMSNYLSFYRGRRVLITGHTGFKGAYLCRILQKAGAEVTGYALMPPTEPSLFELAHLKKGMTSVMGDVRDFDSLKDVIRRTRPEVVFHLAAQPLVRLSYEEPRLTFETNIMGTVNLLEAIRQEGQSVISLVNVTTDKVYENHDLETAFAEDDPLNGYDPYSNSKSCSDIITQSYRRSFFGTGDMAVSTARAGNVIGGCDFAKDRLIPDCVRAAAARETIILRNPHAVRPFQHVFEPLAAYLLLGMRQVEERSLEGAYNVGPDRSDCVPAGVLAETFCRAWNDLTGDRLDYKVQGDGGPHEAGFLMLDNSKIKEKLGWESRWDILKAVEKTAEMEDVRLTGGSVRKVLDEQIGEYFNV